MSKLVRGSDLNDTERARVLARFPYRWTAENRADSERHYRAMGLEPPRIRPVSDAEWLRVHAFYITTGIVVAHMQCKTCEDPANE